MKATEGKIGRVFLIRLEEGDVLPECIERFAIEKKIYNAHIVLIGGIGSGQVVTGPRYTDEMPPDPMLIPVDGAHEVHATGIIAPDKNERPVLHMHGSLGRSGQSLTGCFRPGVKTWLVGEAIIYEIVNVEARRLTDEKSGFDLLTI